MSKPINCDCLQELLSTGVENNIFTAAQAAWIKDNNAEILCAGNTQSGPICSDTLFDIASVTKVYTASACLRLIAENKLKLEDKIGDLLPEFNCPAKSATLEQILAHEAGFIDWAPLFEEVDSSRPYSTEVRDTIIKKAIAMPLSHEPGVKVLYSDLGFIALTAILERISGKLINVLIREEVLEPLKLEQTAFKPGNKLCELQDKNYEHDRVNDDNAWAMGGVSGHAGLFASAIDTAAFGYKMLEAVHNGQWLPKRLANSAIKRRPLGRGLGWDLKDTVNSSVGTLMGPKTFGHLGFTGCSLWVDPDSNLSVALLTNRFFCNTDAATIKSFRIAFHDLLMKELD